MANTRRISMIEAVREAMKKSKDVTEFEQRVHEIYMGDEMVLVEVTNQGREQLVSGYADLNNNLEIDHDGDDKLFTFRRWYEGDRPRYEMRGYGVNSYYHYSYPHGTNLLTTYLLINALTQPRYMTPVYHTTVVERRTIRDYRNSYRRTPSYRNQVDSNRRFQTRMSSKHGTTYRKASASANRQKWATSKGVNLKKATSASKSGVSRGFTGSKSARSSWSSRGFGGFRGGTAGAGVGPLVEWNLSKAWAAIERS